jgi:hypothetical protein
METRTAAVAIALAVLSTTAGCGFILGTEALSFAATPATVSDAALDDTGYERADVRAQQVNRTFEVAGQSREVQVTNQLARYERDVDLSVVGLGRQRAGVFVAFSTPQVEIAGQTFNPLAEMSNRELLAQFESSYSGLSVGERVDSRQVTMLGETTAMERFEGQATLAGSEVPVYVEVVTRVRHDGDFVVALAVYPQALNGERDTVVRLVEGVEHGGA